MGKTDFLGITAHLRHPNSRAVLVALLLALVTFAAFWPVRHCGFLNYDDQEYVTDNPRVRAGLTWSGVAWAFTTTHAANWHPLTWLSHMLDGQLYGLNPAGHHLTNLFWHIANTVLLFFVLRRLTASQPEVQSLTSEVGSQAVSGHCHPTKAPTLDFRLQTRDLTLWCSAMVAALFALHPLHVESVAWVSERKDVLSTFFFLLTLWAYAKYVSGARGQVSGAKGQESGGGLDATRNTQHATRFYWLAFLFFALGLMSKPMLVTLPFVLLLLDYWPLQRFTIDDLRFTISPARRVEVPPNHKSGLLWEKIPFFALTAASCVVTVYAQRSGGAVVPMEAIAFGGRLANALLAYALYLGKTVWPVNLAVYYPHPVTVPLWQVIGAALVLAAVTSLVALFVRRRPYLLTGWLWYLGMLVPVIGLVQVGGQSLADRYTYVPLIGIFLTVVWLASEFVAARPWAARVLWPLAVVVLLACFGVTRAQLQHWRSSESLFRHAVRVTTNNFVMLKNLGTAVTNRDEKLYYLREALRLDPGFADAHNNVGLVFAAEGNLPEAMVHYREALRVQPDFADAYNNLGVALRTLGQYDEAVAHFRAALKLSPNSERAHINLAAALLDRGQTDEAVALLQQALRINPDSAPAHNTLGVVLDAQGKRAKAVLHYERAVRLDPDNPDAHGNLGGARLDHGRMDEALTHLRRAIELNPASPDLQNNLGIALLRQGRMAEAAERFQESLRLKPGQAVAHYHLGVALADRTDEARTIEAIGHLRKAIELRSRWAAPLNELAWRLATHPSARIRNGSEAVELASRAVELTRTNDAAVLDTLAAAYAEAGRFIEAANVAGQAAALAQSAGQSELAAQIRARRDRYQSGEPFRE